MVIDTHAHVFFLDSFIDYDNKPLFQYMDEQKVDICSCIAAANKENDGVIENAAAEKLFDVGHPGFLLQSHFALESIPAAGESGSAFRRAPRKTRFFRIYEEKGNCENE